MGFGQIYVGQYALLALEQLQTHVGGTQATRDADQVVLLGPRTVGCVALLDNTRSRSRDDQTGQRGACVTTRQVDLLLVAGKADTLIQIVERLHGNLRRDTDRDHQLTRTGIHRREVTHNGRHDFVAQVLEREVGQIEIDPLEKRVGG